MYIVSCLVLICFIVSQLPILTIKTYATGGLLVSGNIGSGVVMTRSGNVLTATNSTTFQESGFITDTICTADVVYSLAPDPNGTDYWDFTGVTYTKIKMANTTDNSSCKVVGSNFEITNNAGNSVGTTEVTIPNTEMYGIYVDATTGYAYAADVYTTPPQKHAGGFDQNDRPIITALMRTLQTSQNVVAGYSNTGSGAISTTDVATVKAWFGTDEFTAGSLKMSIYDNPGQPPKVFVPKNDTVKRPDIAFKLMGYAAVGQNLLPFYNHEWVSFGAYASDGTKISNIYLLLNDDQTEMVVYDSGSDLSTLEQGKYDDGSFVNLDKQPISTDDLGMLYAHIENDPNDGSQTCSSHNAILSNSLDNSVRVTGPVGKGLPVDPSQSDLTEKTVPYQNTLFDSNASKKYSAQDIFNLSVCANLTPNGWLQYWGISGSDIFNSSSVVDSALGGECGWGYLFKTGLGDALPKIATCIYDTVFKKMIDWATGLVISAAGVSYAPTYYKNYDTAFINRSYWLG